MYYSDLVKKACLIAFEAHKNDSDKSGYPYILHPFYLATQFSDEATVCTALLHDVIEDHGDRFDFAYLKNEGFGEEVLGALKLLTHEPGVEYMDYVRALGENPIARRVKTADLSHNMDPTRMPGKLPPKIALYREAFAYLSGLEEKDRKDSL